MNKLTLVLFSLLLFGDFMAAQQPAEISQYIHNRYAINPAFAGNRDALSLFGGFRKKWAGINGAPTSQYFSGHAPLKNEQVALGMSLYNSNYSVVGQSGGSFSYTYRIQMDNRAVLAFGLTAGANLNSAKWTNINTFDNGVDPEFAENETDINPLVGFGVAWYGEKYFAGISVPNSFAYSPYDSKSAAFDLAKSDYLFTGGYMFDVTNKWGVQPSFLARYNAEITVTEANLTVLYNQVIWAGASYRTTEDAVVLLGYQITPQLRFAYSFDYSLSEINTYNNGTHEVSLQFDFGYKIKTSNPKFF